MNRVVPSTRVIDEAIALAERIGENSPIAVRNSRRLVREAAELSEDEVPPALGPAAAVPSR